MAKRKKKAKSRPKRKAKRSVKIVKPPVLPNHFVVEKEIDGIFRLLSANPSPETGFFDPPEDPLTLETFENKKVAEGFLATAFPGDFSVVAVPLSKYYVMLYTFENGFSLSTKIVRSRNAVGWHSAKSLIKNERKVIRLEQRDDAKALKETGRQLARFEKAVAKYGA